MRAEGETPDDLREGNGQGGHWMTHFKGKKAVGSRTCLRSWVLTVLLATSADFVFGFLHRAP